MILKEQNASSVYHVGVFGTYELFSLGDTMFPVVTEIKKRFDGKSAPNGIYHVTDLGQITWFDFAKEIFAQGVESGYVTNKACAVNPCATSEYPIPAKRPAYSVLCKSKVQKTLGITLPQWKESLRSFLKDERFDMKFLRVEKSA